MFKRFFLFLAFIFFFNFLNATNATTTLNIGIFTTLKSNSLIILSSSGTYDVYGDGKKIFTLSGNSFLQLAAEDTFVYVKNFNQQFGKYSSVKFNALEAEGSFKIKSVNPATDVFTYSDNLEISIYQSSLKNNQNNYFRIVNVIDIEHYVAGVLEAEIGKTTNAEFLKVQAIICRTYALNNIKRHQQDGYQLCDQVHCQAYKGKCRFNSLIIPAVQETKSRVIVDKNLRLITAAFHSNCGGKTRNSEEVWSDVSSYLRSVVDTFCYTQPHATWEKYIAIKDWQNYLLLKKPDKQDNPMESIEADNSYNYQATNYQQNYVYQGINIPMKTVRNDWNLKSSSFSILELQDSLLMKGKGSGHGVGMCQEGAMRMGELGYSCEDIIKFYYKEVTIIGLEMLKFFNQ